MGATQLYIITGANRGFGKAIAQSLCTSAEPRRFILVGRDEGSLAAVRGSLLDVQGTEAVDIVAHEHVLKDGVSVQQHLLPQLDSLVTPLVSTLSSITLINNAGSTGDLSRQVGSYEPAVIQQYIDMNLTSYFTLINGILKLHQGWSGVQLTLVNISSLLAVQAFSHWGLYATGKAARDMLLAVVAKENKDVRTLSYAPGPLDNEMQQQVRDTLGDAEQAALYKDMADKGNLVTMESSASKLVSLLEKNVFESGAHIDFFDI
ncbi:hypothetical protein BC940DRAFT_249709 [Gongronella butleri]|nr:hypothetical protein BC940DRAFT_249709 [Gongronella butleri]